MPLLWGLLMAWGVAAQQQERPVHPLTDMSDSSSAVDVRYVFPDHEDQRLPLDKLVTIVGGFANGGNTSLNITSVMGSVNSPFSFAYYLLNMSKQDMNIEVAPGTERSFEYTFKIHPSVSAAKFRVAITVFYEDDEESFATTFFNSTVTFFDAEDGGAGGGGTTWLLVLGAGFYVWFAKFDGKQRLQDAGVRDFGIANKPKSKSKMSKSKHQA